jgi:hypothetical protein
MGPGPSEIRSAQEAESSGLRQRAPMNQDLALSSRRAARRSGAPVISSLW